MSMAIRMLWPGTILSDNILLPDGFIWMVWGQEGDDTINGGNDGNEFYGGDGNDVLTGGTASDSLYGDAGNDRLSGGAGYDNLFGGSGNDTLLGGSGNDWLQGGSGNDRLVGGTGFDQLEGGAGADLFVFNTIGDSVVCEPFRSPDFIWDFQQGIDRIDLSGIDADPTVAGNQAFSFGRVLWTDTPYIWTNLTTMGNERGVVVNISLDGDITPEGQIFVVGENLTLQASDFIL